MRPSNQTDFHAKTLEAIYGTAVDAIITIDELGMIQSANPATETLFGYPPEDLLGKNINMLMPQPFRAEHDGYLQNYLSSGIAKIIGIGREVLGARQDGTTFPIHLAVSEINVGEKRLFTGIIRDLTEFKLLEAQQTTLGRIIEDSLNEVFIFDIETFRFISVNHGARDNLGYSIHELREMSPVDINPEYDLDHFKQKIQPLIDGREEKLQYETKHLRKDNTTYEVEVHLQTSSYLNKRVVVATVLDVSERKLAERMIQQQQELMQEELERLVELRTKQLKETQAELVRSEKFSTLGKVAGGIAHEIRNPLNAVKTSAYYLLNAKQPSKEKIKEHLERIDRQVTVIDNVVTALSDVAKLPEANLTPVDVERVLKTAVLSISSLANIAIKYDLPNDLPHVLVDEHQILIAIKNLVRNARDAMKEGGTLTFGAKVGKDSVELSISDTGVGIPLSDLNKILEPLYTTKARGMGLGLSITRAIVEKNQGTLRVESELGKGSCFSIDLKRQPDARSTQPS